MYLRYIAVILMFACYNYVFSEETDTLKITTLDEVTVKGSYQQSIDRNVSLPVSQADKNFLTGHFKGNLMQTLEYVAGVRSMDIGSGFSKPMIRGLGFNRVAVVENGIKQEGQQWGADHGLEIDAFDVERVLIRKGPSSLLFGSDAMGGVIEILPPHAPSENQFYGEASLLGRSVSETLAGSLMFGVKHDALHVKLRFTEQDYGDYRIPADTVVYLTQRMPIHGRRLKNTAGLERNASLFSEYSKGCYSGNIVISNAFQKSGFFTGAHGIPDAMRLQDDGDSRNIDFPYSSVNHLKITSHQQFRHNSLVLLWDGGFQHNQRKEMSLFHTHYGNQPAPAHEPDLELAFSLVTMSSTLKADWFQNDRWKHTVGLDVQNQHNSIAGYSFLLPEFKRFTAGILYLSTFKPAENLTFSGGIRSDYGRIKSSGYQDVYLAAYLSERNYPDDVIEAYRWRSYPFNPCFFDISGSFGLVWQADDYNLFKVNFGRSFRLPGANELASNGVHHGAFRHEKGNPSLDTEKGWQSDASYSFSNEGISLSASPFFNWFENYIYLRPTGEWSILPHAGQIYSYTGTKAIFTGSEAELNIDFLQNMTYHFSGEYIYTYNVDEHTPMSFSPPASMRNSLTFKHGNIRLSAEIQSIATQNRVSKNEDTTRGANLVHLNATLTTADAIISLSVYNLMNTAYYNHLSFYRKAEIPESGRNIQLSINVPFKKKLK
jgi:iron complex outermembrane receptor protein